MADNKRLQAENASLKEENKLLEPANTTMNMKNMALEDELNRLRVELASDPAKWPTREAWLDGYWRPEMNRLLAENERLRRLLDDAGINHVLQPKP